MKKTKIKYIVLTAVIFILSFCVLAKMFISPATKQSDNNFDTNSLADTPKILMAVNNDFIVVDEKKYTYVNGIHVNKPYIKDGISYYPLDVIAELYGASILEYPYNIYIITNRFNEKTVISSDYTTAVYNNAEMALDSSPINIDGVLYLPIRNMMEMLGLNYSYDYYKGIVKMNANSINKVDYDVYQEKGTLLNYTNDMLDELFAAADDLGVEYEDLLDYARQGRLYTSDSNGKLQQIIVRDDFKIEKNDAYNENTYNPNSYFVEGYYSDSEFLYSYIDGKMVKVDYSPKVKEKKNSVNLISEFFNTKYLQDIYNLENKELLHQIYDKIQVNGRTNNAFLYHINENNDDIMEIKKDLMICTKREIPLNTKYDYYMFDLIADFQNNNSLNVTGMIDEETLNKIESSKNNGSNEMTLSDNKEIEKQYWHDFCQKCKAGDVILCRKSDSTEYGLNNHSAMVIEVLPDDTIHLLQARGIKYGVGYEDELDYLSLDLLYENDYWKKTDVITLYEFPNISNENRNKIVSDACKKYKNYSFGYMGMLGKNETTCGELIRDAYKQHNYMIYDDAIYSITALNQKDDISLNDIIFVPDTIMLSDIMKMKCLWQRIS